jgi:hypothetical protein
VRDGIIWQCIRELVEEEQGVKRMLLIDTLSNDIGILCARHPVLKLIIGKNVQSLTSNLLFSILFVIFYIYTNYSAMRIDPSMRNIHSLIEINSHSGQELKKNATISWLADFPLESSRLHPVRRTLHSSQ